MRDRKGPRVDPRRFPGPPAGVVAFPVDDADVYAERLAAAGATVVTPIRDEPWGQRHTFVTDPTGTLVDVVQPTTPSPGWLAAHGLDGPT